MFILISKCKCSAVQHDCLFTYLTVADPEFAKMAGADHGEREHKRVPGGGAPSGFQGQSPLWGSVAKPLKLKAFVHFHTKSGQKLRI